MLEPAEVTGRADLPRQLVQADLPHRLAAKVLAGQLVHAALQSAFEVEVCGVDRQHPAVLDQGSEHPTVQGDLDRCHDLAAFNSLPLDHAPCLNPTKPTPIPEVRRFYRSYDVCGPQPV